MIKTKWEQRRNRRAKRRKTRAKRKRRMKRRRVSIRPKGESMSKTSICILKPSSGWKTVKILVVQEYEESSACLMID